VDDLIGDFVADTREGFERLAPDLAAWSADASDRLALDGIFRFVHTVRGNCGFLNFERFERLCLPTEQVLANIREGHDDANATQVNAIVAVINRIGALADAIEAGIGLPAHDEAALIAALGVEIKKPAKARIPAVSIQQQRSRTIRMPVEQFEQLAQCVEGVAEAHRRMLAILTAAPGAQTLTPVFSELSGAISEMTQALTLSRSQPIERLYAGLERIVSQTAETLGKRVTLEMSGGALMVDREVVDGLRDPLLHIIRNALDHGLETPEQRASAGKDEAGKIEIAAVLDGNALTMTISDDGSGIDRDRVFKSAQEAGIEFMCGAEEMSDMQLLTLLSSPGITTANSANAFSGRGVGLDAVSASLKRLGGSFTLTTRPQSGVSMILQVPLRQRVTDAA
jgi:two-component system, chemotaxis family, sensor kinase CheA